MLIYMNSTHAWPFGFVFLQKRCAHRWFVQAKLRALPASEDVQPALGPALAHCAERGLHVSNLSKSMVGRCRTHLVDVWLLVEEGPVEISWRFPGVFFGFNLVLMNGCFQNFVYFAMSRSLMDPTIKIIKQKKKSLQDETCWLSFTLKMVDK